MSITGLDAANKLKFTNIKSEGNGGLIYSKALLGLTLKDITLVNSESTLDGGVAFLMENQPVIIERLDATTFKSGTHGAFINAQKASNIDIKFSNF